MKQDMKICLPYYKIAYSLSFLIILSFIRGISYFEEIGPAIDTNLALLTIVFCADTYTMEKHDKRWELFSLYARKKKMKAIIQRMIAQVIYLSVIAGLGYFCFMWQQPHKLNEYSDVRIYILYLVAVITTILFWSMAVMTVSNICRSHWSGIAICLALWLLLNSTFGDALLGNYNIFAYSLRSLSNGLKDDGWLLGKGIGVILALMLCGCIPYILKKRG